MTSSSVAAWQHAPTSHTLSPRKARALAFHCRRGVLPCRLGAGGRRGGAPPSARRRAAVLLPPRSPGLQHSHASR